MKRLFFLPSTKCHNLGLDFVLNVIKILRNDSISKDYVHNSLYNISKEMCKTDKENVEGTLENKTNTDIIPFQELGEVSEGYFPLFFGFKWPSLKINFRH